MTQVEYLARELCAEYWRGKCSEGAKYTNFHSEDQFVNAMWSDWEDSAEEILDTLERRWRW